MTGNVAMHDPCSWVVGLECYHHVSAIREQNNIATWWSVEVQIQIDWEMIYVVLLEDGEVVTMQVNLMRD